MGNVIEMEFKVLTPRGASGNLLPVTTNEEYTNSSASGSLDACGEGWSSHTAAALVSRDLYALPDNDFTRGELAKMPLRFQKKVRVEWNGCWIWTGAKYTPGYGQYRVPGGNRMSAHTYAYLTLVGPIATGLEPDHMCGRRACVNPYHLQLIKHGPNCRRRLVSIRKSLRHMIQKIEHATGFKGTMRTLSRLVLSDVDARRVGKAFQEYITRVGQEIPYTYPHQKKRCAKCLVVKPIPDFHRVRDWSAKYSDYWYPCSYCKPCHSARSVYNARLLREKRRKAAAL